MTFALNSLTESVLEVRVALNGESLLLPPGPSPGPPPPRPPLPSQLNELTGKTCLPPGFPNVRKMLTGPEMLGPAAFSKSR